MTKRVLLFFLITFLLNGHICSGHPVRDSVALRKNAFYYEFGGNGIKGSINYDRLITWKNAKFKNIFRVGLGYYGSSSDDSIKWVSKIIVSEINFILGKGKYLGYWEIGVGYSYFIDPVKYYRDKVLSEKKNWSVNFIRIGYRMQAKNGVQCRIAFTPTYSRDFYKSNKYSFGLWGGVSLGYSF
ncbi:MAG: hypothetical protein ACXVPU_08665 [Bacteroidia bacterium]